MYSGVTMIRSLLLPSFPSMSHSMCTRSVGRETSGEKGNFYRNVMVFVCGGSAAASIFALALMTRDTIGAQKRKKSTTTTTTTTTITPENKETDDGVAVVTREEDDDSEDKERNEETTVAVLVPPRSPNHAMASNGILRT